MCNSFLSIIALFILIHTRIHYSHSSYFLFVSFYDCLRVGEWHLEFNLCLK